MWFYKRNTGVCPPQIFVCQLLNGNRNDTVTIKTVKTPFSVDTKVSSFKLLNILLAVVVLLIVQYYSM